MSTDIPIIPAPPIDTLTELRRQNSALLQRNVAGAGTTPPSPGELLGFLTAAAKLGRSLEDFETRETAQGIMDFWIANLLSAAPEASEGTRPFTLEPFDECQASADAHEAHQLRVEAVEAAQKVETLLPTAKDEIALKNVKISWIHDYVPRCLKPWAMSLAGRGSDTAVMERLLMSFVRLKEKSTEAYTVPVGENEAIFRETKARPILDQLITAGVIKRQEADGATSYVLAHETLLQKWDFLADIVSKRRAFRQLARGWENSGRQPGSLITSSVQLQEAIDLPHTDEMEDAFIEASRRAGESFRRVALTLVSTALVVLCFMVWRLSVLNTKIEAEHAEVIKVNTQLEQKNVEVEQAEKKAVQTAALNSISKSQLYSLRDLLFNRELLVNPADPQGKKLQKLTWRGPVTPAVEKAVYGVLYAIDPPIDEAKSQLEVFLHISSSVAAQDRIRQHLAVLENPARPGHFAFQLRTHAPLPRLVLPDRGKEIEVRYYYLGAGPTNRQVDAAAAEKDSDKLLADQARERLIASGIPERSIKVVSKPDNISAPQNFIQIAFPVGFAE